MSDKKSVTNWYLVNDIYNMVRNKMRNHLFSYDLSPAQYDVLFQLFNSPGLSQKELGELLFVSKGNVTGLINRLEKKKLVERKNNPTDGRSYLLYLTDAGTKLSEKVIPYCESLISEYFKTTKTSSNEDNKFAKTLESLAEELSQNKKQ